MNTRGKYSKIRMKKKPVKKLPQWMIDRIKEEAALIAEMYKKL